jgi:hypothetical protein
VRLIPGASDFPFPIVSPHCLTVSIHPREAHAAIYFRAAAGVAVSMVTASPTGKVNGISRFREKALQTLDFCIDFRAIAARPFTLDSSR